MQTLEKWFGQKGKIVLITGACGQLGSATVEAFIDVGAKVVGIDARVTKKNPLAEYFEVDIRNQELVEKTMAEVVSRYGRIDVLINNAGVSCFEPFEDRPEESFDWVMDVNLKGTFFCIQSLVRLMRKNSFGGSIINIGSFYGVISPDERIYTDCARKNSEIYGATKAGVIQMTRYFAAHLAKDGVRVNCVSPGGILNPENPQGQDFQKNYSFRCPMGRMARVEEITGAILYMASDGASYTTGQNLVVDGGMSVW